MHLAQREIAEPETQFGGNVGVGELLKRQVDIQPDGLGAGLESPAVGCFHDAGAATGNDHQAVVR